MPNQAVLVPTSVTKLLPFKNVYQQESFVQTCWTARAAAMRIAADDNLFLIVTCSTDQCLGHNQRRRNGGRNCTHLKYDSDIAVSAISGQW